MGRAFAVMVAVGSGFAQAQQFGCAWLSDCGGSSTAFQASSASSADSTRSTQASNASTGATSGSLAESGGSSGIAPSTFVLSASAVIVVAAAGIVAVVYVVQIQADAKAHRGRFQKLHPPAPGPDPATQAPPQPTLDQLVMARAWLRANALQLEQDLALGAGPAIDDLAHLAGISRAHRARFGRLLQQHRGRFHGLRELTPREAGAVLSGVGELVMADPLLRRDGERLLASTFF